MLIKIVTVIISSVSGLVGVIVGALLSSRSVKWRERQNLLIEFYAAVFSAYTHFVLLPTVESQAALISQIEQARLICSPETRVLLEALEDAVTRNNPSAEQCGKIIVELRHQTIHDVGNCKRK